MPFSATSLGMKNRFVNLESSDDDGAMMMTVIMMMAVMMLTAH